MRTRSKASAVKNLLSEMTMSIGAIMQNSLPLPFQKKLQLLDQLDRNRKGKKVSDHDFSDQQRTGLLYVIVNVF